MGLHGCSTNSSSRSQDNLDPKSSSYLDLVMGRCTLDDVMREFQMNGSDSPYNPDEDRIWGRHTDDLSLSGLGPAGPYLRQKSWPAPERSPAPRLVRPRSLHAAWTDTTPIPDETPKVTPTEYVTSEQSRVLSTLPDSVLYSLLQQMQHERRNKMPQECRFCKNNGERESYYTSHVLKDAWGRVSCPVLRALVCRRCGAKGDHAHTIKYCPLSTNEERIKSAAMMRSVRMASGKRRHSYTPSIHNTPDYVLFGEPTPSLVDSTNDFVNYDQTPLDPSWAALEQKLTRIML